MTLTAFIFARGGSKGLPGKNIRPIAGKPLIAWSIEAALDVFEISRVVVSTDSEEIASFARKYGAEVPFMRPDSLASDTASEWMAWQHALVELEKLDGQPLSPFISVPATAPLRLPEDISACLELYRSGDFDAVFAVTDALRNPWFNMVSMDADAQVNLVNSDGGQPSRRQDAKTVYDITTVAYVVDPTFIAREKRLFAGRVGAVKIPVERSIDIDTLYDFEIAEFLLNKREADR